MENEQNFTENNLVTKRQSKTEGRKAVLSYFHDLVCLVAGVVLLFSLCFRVVIVSGPSMNNTLIDGDWLLLLGNVLYTEPDCGDVIVASKDSFDDGAPIIKRIIALEGQAVDIDFENEDYNGIDIARRLRSVNKKALVFFVTNFIDYAPAGYEVQAFRYILKRDIRDVLERYILQAMEQLALQRHRRQDLCRFRPGKCPCCSGVRQVR